MRAIQRNVREAAAQQSDENADDLLTRARAMAPQLSGEMMEDSQVIGRDRKDSVLRTVVFSSVYAVRRHEDIYNLGPVSTAKSPSPDGPVGRKYLESPFNNNIQRYMKLVGTAVSKAIRMSVR
jgi:hypothetical protein